MKHVHSLKVGPHTRYLLITKGKIETVHWIILADTVNQVTKANMHSNGENGLLCAS